MFTEPLPAALAALADRIRATGVRVDLRVESEPRDRALAATAFRVVQEALTNAARHAPGCRVEVRVACGQAGLEIEVYDDGPGASDEDDMWTDPLSSGARWIAHQTRSVRRS